MCARPDIYVIALGDKHIVYRPRRRLAFVANAAMVNAVAAVVEGRSCPDGGARRFLEELGFLEPDPEPPPAPGLPGAPTTAVLLLTSACNLRCVYCYAAAGEGRAETMSLELARQAVDTVVASALEAGETSFALAVHGGGEPTTADATLRGLVEYARGQRLECRLSLTTNGVWRRAQLDWIPTAFDSVSLSCDGLPAVHDRQRPRRSGLGSAAQILAAAAALDDAGTPYGMRLTVLDDGLDELVDGVRFLCASTSSRTFQVEPAAADGRARRSGRALNRLDAFADAVVAAGEVARAAGRHLYYSGARPWVICERFCQAPERALVVTPSGRLTACYEVCGEHHPLVDVLTVGRIGPGGAVVDDAARCALLARMAERRDQCRGCFCYWHCAGDCAARVLSEDPSSHLRFGRRCELNRAVTRKLLIGLVRRANGVWQGNGGPPPALKPCEALW